jgi:hypothetical protein
MTFFAMTSGAERAELPALALHVALHPGFGPGARAWGGREGGRFWCELTSADEVGAVCNQWWPGVATPGHTATERGHTAALHGGRR